MKKSRIISFLLMLSLSFSFASCGSTYNYKRESVDDLMIFSSSDKGLDNFVNDFFERHLRYNENSIGNPDLGSAAFFDKEWESMALSYFDVTTNTMPYNRHITLTDWLTGIPVDKFGYVWNGFDQLENTDAKGPQEIFKQGWAFPNYLDSYTTKDFTDPENPKSLPTKMVGYEFAAKSNQEDWTVSDNNQVEVVGGVFNQIVNGNTQAEFISPEIEVDSYYSPFIELDARFTDYDSFGMNSNIDDIYFSWITKEDTVWNDEKTVSQKEFVTMPEEKFSAMYARQLYFPMYLHSDWKDHTITQFKITVKAKEGKTLNCKLGLNYVRMGYDTRQANNMSILITASKNYYEFTGDNKFLTNNITRLRSAMQCYLTMFSGKSGLIDTSCQVGHNGNKIDKYGNFAHGYGIGDGYYDITALPNINVYTNIYFNRALQSMIYLEEMVEKNKINVANPVVKASDGVTDVAYNESVDSLKALQKLSIEKFQDEFYDSKTGRFHAGKLNNEIMDYGFINFNLEIIASGLATEDQSKSVMDWISGKRTIDSDIQKNTNSVIYGATGKDIYKYEFAPLINTVDMSEAMYWEFEAPFGTQVQNGGTALFLAYYDLISRNMVYGVEDSFKRFKEIENWYNKVSAAKGKDKLFYDAYYESLDEEITLQRDGPGTLGIDGTFPESALLYRSIPDIYFGLGSEKNNVLEIAPNLPSSLTYMKLENLLYHGVHYDASVGKDFVQLNNVRGNKSDLMVEVKLQKPKKNFSIYINGKKSNNYTVQDGYVLVNIPFDNGKVAIL